MNRVVLIIVFAACATLFSCNKKVAPPVPPTPVNLFTVRSQQVLYYDNFPATVQALSQVDLRPQVQGYITGIFFTEGTHVNKGQKLYEIDGRLYQAAYDQAAANLKVAQGNQLQAQQDADRYTFLNSQDAVAKQLYDHAIIALQNSKGQVAAAQEAVNSAKINLTFSIITAPFDGTIGFSQVKMGNTVTPGQTILNTVSTDDPMAVDFLINEAQLTHYQNLQQSKTAVADSLFTISLPDRSIYPYPGKISVIDRSVDPQTGTIRIRLEFPNPKHSLRSGMSCIVRVHNQETTPQMVIPGKAVVEQMGEYFVFIVKDTLIVSAEDSARKQKESSDTAKGPKLRAFQRKIQLGQTIDDHVVIKGGIEDGDEIVVDGVQALHEGSKVAVSKKQPGGTTNETDKKAGNK